MQTQKINRQPLVKGAGLVIVCAVVEPLEELAANNVVEGYFIPEQTVVQRNKAYGNFGNI